MASHGADPEGGGPREHEFTRGQSQSRNGHTPNSISLPPNICTISVHFPHQKEVEELFLTPMGFILIPSSQFVRQRFLRGLLEGEPGQQSWLLAGLHLLALGNANPGVTLDQGPLWPFRNAVLGELGRANSQQAASLDQTSFLEAGLVLRGSIRLPVGLAPLPTLTAVSCLLQAAVASGLGPVL